MKRMTALKRHIYGGRPRAAGETFEVEDRYVRMLQALGHAEIARPAPVKEAATYERRDMRAEDPAKVPEKKVVRKATTKEAKDE